jgi:hypothetical protein
LAVTRLTAEYVRDVAASVTTVAEGLMQAEGLAGLRRLQRQLDRQAALLVECATVLEPSV